MAQENSEHAIEKFRFESETQSEKEKEQMGSKILKMGGILILCFLLLNFILVVVAMNRTSEISSPFSTQEFSAAVNQSNKNEKTVDKMKLELGGIEKWMNSTEEKFEGHQFQVQSLRNQTKIDKQLEALENENGELKKSHEELKEQFRFLSQKIDQLEMNISKWNQMQNVPLVPTSTPEMTTTPAENEDEEQTDPPHLSRSCGDSMENFPSPRSPKQTVYPHGNRTSLEVLCDFETDGGGWTVIQKRSSGPRREFKQNLTAYKNGFGSLDKNFWLGLENIHALTQNGDQELRIELEDFEGEKSWAKYSSFSISDASDFYRLTITGFYENSTAGDSMTNPSYGQDNNGMRFSTKEKEKDNTDFNCAGHDGAGGWWFPSPCGNSNLNGLYLEKAETDSAHKGIAWFFWKTDWSDPLAKSEMKIRQRKS